MSNQKLTGRRAMYASSVQQTNCRYILRSKDLQPATATNASGKELANPIDSRGLGKLIPGVKPRCSNPVRTPVDSFAYLPGSPSLRHICPASANGISVGHTVPEFIGNLLNESHKSVDVHTLKNCSKQKFPLFEQRRSFPSKSSQPKRNLYPLNKCIPACSAEFHVDSTPRRDQSSYQFVSRLCHPLPTHTLAVNRFTEASSFVASTWSNSNNIVQLNYSQSIPFATAAAAAQPIIQIPRGSIKIGHLIKTDHSISKLMHPTVRESSSLDTAESPGNPVISDSQEGAVVLQSDGCGHKNEMSRLHSLPQISSGGPLSPRTVQKAGTRTKNVKKHSISNDWPHAITAQYTRTHSTGFAAAIHKHPPPVPPGLLKITQHIPTAGMVKTMLRLVPPEASKFGSLGTCLTIEKRRKQATLICPSPSTAIPVGQRRAGFGAPKMVVFDEVFSEQEATGDICAAALPDIIQAVVSGSDCCLIVLTNCRSNHGGIITGSDKPSTDLGIIPCSISWLFKLIAEQKEQTGARFSVRVSALEVDGQDESVKDLLVEVAQASDALGAHPPGLYLREESVARSSVENQSELRAPTPEKAAFYLDSALNARARANKQHATALVQSDALHTLSDLQTSNLNTSHFFFTLHLYQYRIEKCGGSSEVSGGHSRLHLIELDARCPDARDVASAVSRISTSNTPSSASPPITTSSRMTKTKLSTDSIISVILSILSGQTYTPYRHSPLARLLRDCLGGVDCQHCIVIEASSGAHHYAENLQLLQLVQRVQHHRKRRNPSRLVSVGSEMSGTAEKPSHGTSSEGSSSCDSFGLRRANRTRIHTGPYSVSRRSAFHRTKAGKRKSNVLNGTHSSERDYTSSSEQSCDTVIFLGRNEYHGSMAAEVESQQSKPGLCRIISGPLGETQPDNVDSGLPNQLSGNSLPSDATQAPAGSGDCSEIKASTKERTEGRVKTIMELRRANPRGNIHAWSRAAVKNAIETLSTQKEQWVDGPKANFSPKKLMNAEPIQMTCQSRTTKRECPTIEDKNTHSEATTDRWPVEDCSVQCEAYGDRNIDFSESSTPPCLSAGIKAHTFSQAHDYGLYGSPHPPDGSAVDTGGQGFLQTFSGTQEITEHSSGVKPCAQCDRSTANEVPNELGKLHLTGTLIKPIVGCSACSGTDALATRSRSIFGPLATNLTRTRAQEADISIQNDLTVEGSNRASPGSHEQHYEKSSYHTHSSLNFNPFVAEWLKKHRVLTSSTEVDEQYAEKVAEMKSSNDEARKVQNGHAHMDHPTAIPSYLIGGPTAEAEKAISRPYVSTAQPERRETVCQKCTNLASQKPNRTIPTGEICDTNDHFSSKEINSNFARIAKWVKSVAMETGDTTVAEQRGGKITSNDGACLLNPIQNPNKPEGTKMRVFRLLFPTGLSNDKTPTNYLHANTFSTQNAIPQKETEPIQSATGIPVPCVPTLFPDHHRYRRGRSVPPRGLKQSGTRQLPSQATLHTLPLNDMSTTHPNILSSEFPVTREQGDLPGSLELRRPDGSSNPHLHLQEQGLSADILPRHLENQPMPLCTKHYQHPRCKHFTFCVPNYKTVGTKHVVGHGSEDEIYASIQPSFLCANIHYSLQKKYRSPEFGKHLGRPNEKTKMYEKQVSLETPTARRRPRSYCSSLNSVHSDETGICNPKARHPSDQPFELGEKHVVIIGAKSRNTKEARSKSSKGRLGFLTSPLFGKRREKVHDAIQKTGTPDNEKQRQLRSNKANPNTAQIHAPRLSIAAPTSLDFRPAETSPFKQQAIHTSVRIAEVGMQHKCATRRTCAEGTGLSCSRIPSHSSRKMHSTRWPDMTHGSPKFSSKQSSSGHGSECSSNPYPQVGTEIHEGFSCPGHQYQCPHYQRPNRARHSESNQVGSTTVAKHRCRICFHRRCDCATEVGMKFGTLNEHNTIRCGLYGRNVTRCSSNRTDCKIPLEPYRKYSVTDSVGVGAMITESNGKNRTLASPSVKSSVITQNSVGVRVGGGHTSSGYESIVRDSEVSSHADSTSGSSIGCQAEAICSEHPSAVPVTKGEKTHNVNRPTPSSALPSDSTGKQDLNSERHDGQFANSKCSPASRTMTNGQQAVTANVVNPQNSNCLSASSSSSTSRRSHSAPPCSEDTSEATTSSPISVRYVPPKATTTVVSSLTTSVENSGAAKTDEPSVVTNETHQEEIQEMLRQIRYERIYDLLAQQDTLKMELMKAKDRLMVDPATWSFDVCVAEQMDPDDEGFLDALELETEILQKRVDACKSRVMLITCFDIRTEAEISQPSTITTSSSGF